MNPIALAIQTAARSGFRVAIAACALAAATAARAEPAAPAANFHDLSIEVVGSGRPVVMIPGLNSGPDTWRDTCRALQPQKVQCHLVHLPGFAGLPAAKVDAFLPAMRDRLLAYVAARKLDRPAVVGHSLGGVLALQMAVAEPARMGPLVIVDSLPFLPAATRPDATEAAVRPMAEAMRAQMRAADDASYAQQAAMAMRNMTKDEARTAQLRDWGARSDRATTTQAMFELMTTDLRPQLAAVKSPTLVLGAWAAFKPYGSTKDSTAGIFRAQYAALPGVRIEMSEDGYHFLMWDDPSWVQSNIRDFLAAHPKAR